MKFDGFLKLMDRLLGEDGCPWDREQTHETLRQYLLEECYEVIEAINSSDVDALREELGDVLLQVIFHAKLAEKAGSFCMDDVIDAVSHKLVSRHTHVFGDDKAASGDEVIKIWQENKEKERSQTPVQAMNAVPRALPALVRAAKVLSRSKREMPVPRDIVAGIRERLDRLEEGLVGDGVAGQAHNDGGDGGRVLGELLLELVMLGKVLKIDPEFALVEAVEEFIAGA